MEAILKTNRKKRVVCNNLKLLFLNEINVLLKIKI